MPTTAKARTSTQLRKIERIAAELTERPSARHNAWLASELRAIADRLQPIGSGAGGEGVAPGEAAQNANQLAPSGKNSQCEPLATAEAERAYQSAAMRESGLTDWNAIGKLADLGIRTLGEARDGAACDTMTMGSGVALEAVSGPIGQRVDGERNAQVRPVAPSGRKLVAGHWRDVRVTPQPAPKPIEPEVKPAAAPVVTDPVAEKYSGRVGDVFYLRGEAWPVVAEVEVTGFCVNNRLCQGKLKADGRAVTIWKGSRNYRTGMVLPSAVDSGCLQEARYLPV